MPTTAVDLSPHCPTTPMIGGRLGDHALFASSGGGASGRFVVVDPAAETVRAFDMEAPAGRSYASGFYGGAIGDEFIACWRGGGTGGIPIFISKMKADGSYILRPAPHVFVTNVLPCTAVAGTEVWVFGRVANVLAIFDVGADNWWPSLLTGCEARAEPVFHPGTNRMFVYTSNRLHSFDGNTKARTQLAVLTSTEVPTQDAQVAVIGDIAYWRGSSNFTVIRLDMSAGTTSVESTPVNLGVPLTVSATGHLVTPLASIYQGWNPATNDSYEDAVATVSGSVYRAATVSGRVVSGHR